MTLLCSLRPARELQPLASSFAQDWEEIKTLIKAMESKPLSGRSMNDTPAMQFFGSHEHRMQVSRAIKERLLGKNTICEGLKMEEMRNEQAPREKWEVPIRRLLFDALPAATAECNDSQQQRAGSGLLSPIQSKTCQALRPQAQTSQDSTCKPQTSMPLLSPPPSHSQPPPSFQPFQSLYSPNNTCSSPPQTPFHLSTPAKQALRNNQRLLSFHTPTTSHARENPSQDAVDWEHLPEHPQGTESNDLMDLLDGEAALYEIREMYEEAVCRRLLAQYNARFIRQRREALRIKLGVDERRRKEKER